MAEDLGARELGMVRSQRLDELLNTLRLLQDPSANSRLGIPALDRLLATNTRRFDPTNLSLVPAPPIIEVTSPVPKSGKTELLYWIIANLVLKDMLDEDGGQSQPTTQPPSQPTAIALLTTTTLSIPRLSQICLHQLRLRHPDLDLPTAQSHVHSSLHHIHIFQAPSLQSLISTISTLPVYFLDPSNTSTDRKLAIVLDSASSFFWQDKVATAAIAGRGQAQGQAQGRYPALAAVLGRISAQLQAPIVYTTENISPSLTAVATTTLTATTTTTTSTANTKALKPQLPPPWPSLPCIRLIIKKLETERFGKDVDAETAVKQKESRDKAVRDARFEVCINEWGNEGWTCDCGVSQSFELVIAEAGVEMV